MSLTKFYKNSDLAESLGVSAMSITRYIEQAKKGLNDIELIKHGSDYKIKKTDLNVIKLKELTIDKSKFKNPIKYKKIQIPDVFYSKYSTNEQLEIFRDLKNKMIINQKFTYLENNHKNYYLYQQSRKKNAVRADLLAQNLDFFIKYGEKNNIRYNLIELGPMDLVSSMDFIRRLDKEDLVDSYTAVDISKELLDLNKKQFKLDFPNIRYNNEQVDVETTDVYDITLESKYNSEFENNITIFLVIGSTISNIFKPKIVYQNILDSLTKNDFFVVDLIKEYPEMEKNKIYESNSLFYNYITVCLRDLGLSVDDFSLVSHYDSLTKLRTVRAVLTEHISLISKLSNEHLDFKKGSFIILSQNRINPREDLQLITTMGTDLVNLNTSIELDYQNLVFIKNNLDNNI
ncbi:MAG: L-histidine N(alpha)-methyltransferase [Patescibacteria group bacterium]